MLKEFEEHCSPRQNTIYERYRFQCRNQVAGETGSHYLTELRHAAESCDFANITNSQIIRDRFVHGMRDSMVRERLLREQNVTLERVYEMVQAAEATAEQTHVMSGEQVVCVVKTNSGRGQGHKERLDYAKKQRKSNIECKFCSYEHAPKQWPAYGKECRKCGKMNHFQSKCKQHR